MREADLFVLPSVEDAFGLVNARGMASALPVIVTDHVGASELISDREHGMIVPAGDATALAEAIEQLLESDLGAAPGSGRPGTRRRRMLVGQVRRERAHANKGSAWARAMRTQVVHVPHTADQRNLDAYLEFGRSRPDPI
jgi:glycosyltransferase involved in cell wall biosynthesis